jgi:hypothetical protein
MGCFIPAVHVFHAQENVPGLILKRAVECDNVRGVTIMADLEFSDYLLSHVLLGVDSNHLQPVSQIEGDRQKCK